MSWETMLRKAHDQIDWCIALALKYTLPWWGVTFREFSTPIYPSLHALYATHECAMRYRLDRLKSVLVFAPARHVLTRYPEIGPDNLTAKKGDDEVRRFKKHPYHVRSHFWAGQQAFWEGKAWVDPQLAKYGFAKFDDLSAYSQFSLLLLPRAIGIGCTRGLLRKGQRAVPDFASKRLQPVEAMERWLSLSSADTTPFDGSQTTETVRLRFAWCTRLVLRSKELAIDVMPLSAQPPVPDPGDLVPLPADFYKPGMMKAYQCMARNQGPMPTGPWSH